MANNIEMLQRVAKGLGNLKDDVVFVGGSVAELYADDAELSDVRATLDIDCVVELSTMKSYYELEEELRKRKFRNDTTQGAPICRWIFEDIIVDVMPVDTEVLGFGNKWYASGVSHKAGKILPDGMSIYIFPVEYYLATKFEALNGRGGSDLRLSHDFEDIIYILDNCGEIIENISSNKDASLKTYLKTQCLKLTNDKNLKEAIACALPLYSEEERISFIYDVINGISGMN
ncbi:MAG: hypothetical protein LBV74_04120 [Tannerella sp.]|jgi:hypothetical protein|nr:hypothetical protein [Tannerella sp.]